MKKIKFISFLFLMIMSLGILCSCSGEQGKDGVDCHTPNITIGVNGNWYIDGIDTGVLAQGEKGDTGEQGQPGENGKSAYEMYLESHPEYIKSEEEWMQDLINGNLAFKSYVVTFDSCGGSEVESQVVLHGYKVNLPDEPTRDGYTFEGWFMGEEKWSFIGYVVTENITLTAKWTEKEYKINLISEGKTTQETISYADSIELPIPTHSLGYIFEGWYDENNCLFTSQEYKFDKDITLTAKWFRPYKVTFDSNGGNHCDDYLGTEKIITELPVPNKSGYVFYGWYYNDQEIILPYEYKFDKDITLTAKWIGANEVFNYIELDDNTIKILSYNGTSSNVVIPKKINGRTVVEISRDAFENNKDIVSLVLPSTLITVETGLLEGCTSIERIQISDTILTTLKKMFNANNSSEIPQSLTTIAFNEGSTTNAAYFFGGVSRTFSIELSNDLVKIENYLFKDATWVNEIVIPSKVTSIGYQSFYGCKNLTNIVIPDSVTSIGEGAFIGCSNLTDIKIPKDVTIIPHWLFSDCDKITNLSLPAKISSFGQSFMGAKIVNLYFNGTIENWNNITTGGEGSSPNYQNIYFLDEDGDVSYDNKKYSLLTKVVFKEGVTKIRSDAFFYCETITELVLPSSLTTIGGQSFLGCSNLTSVMIPEGVTSIGDNAFARCSSITSIIVDKNNKYYDSRNNCNAIINSLTNELIAGCKNTIIPNTVSSIGQFAFSDCTELKNILLPSSINSIGESAFSGCTELKNILLPLRLNSIGWSAFYNCDGLTSIVILGGVTTIENYAFSSCDNLIIYCEFESKPAGWHKDWNSSNIPVYWAGEWEYDANGNPIPLS